MVLAGGKGSRLSPLTCHRAKPAVPFGGRYRIIDFALSNLVNSGYRKIYLLTQFMASSLIKHLSQNWHMARFGSFIEVVPAQMRRGRTWYKGTADSVFQNLNLIQGGRYSAVTILGGDHIYLMDFSQMEDWHRAMKADLTISAYPVPIEEAHKFGVLQCDSDGRVVGFQEKPSDPTPLPGHPNTALVSMGNYIFSADVLIEALRADAESLTSSHDFGKDLIPNLLASGHRIHSYDFCTNQIPGADPDMPSYWRDVGTVDAFFDANMDLRHHLPPIDMYNRRWPVRTAQRNYPPARFVDADGYHTSLVDSLVCEGSIVRGAALHRVVAGYACFFHTGAHVEDAVIHGGCNVGAGCQIRSVLMDKNVSIEPGTRIGMEPDEDAERFPFRSEAGRVLLPKGTHVPRRGPVRFARDMADLLHADPDAGPVMEAFRGRYGVSSSDRYSHDAVGPRFETFGKKVTTGLYEAVRED